MQPAMTPPEDTVQFVLDGRTFNLAYDFLAEYTLDRRGVDARMVIPKLITAGPGRLSMTIDVFAAMAANNFDTDAGERVPSAEWWMRQLNGNAEKLAEASKAVADVLGKRLLAAKEKILAAQPATEQTEPPAVQ